MAGYYDLALIIDSDMTLSQLKATFEKLESLNIYIDYNSLELNADFSYIIVQYPDNINLNALDKSISKIDGIEIDYNTMAYWD